jgi:ribosomal protein L33
MSWKQCPLCYHDLEVRQTTPCYVCGAWDGFNTELKPPYSVYLLYTGETITLCRICYVEEILAQQGDLGECLHLPAEKGSYVVHYATQGEPAELTQDKFCPRCRKRLVLLKLIAASQSATPSRREQTI